ncbi:MAG: methyltransferase domain-containing protein [Gemmataceae bacterium]
MTDRLQAEKDFHERQAQARRATFAAEPERLHFADHHYLDHESWIRPAFAQLGEVAGLDVLDLGCGHGMAAVVLARRGARVAACDLAHGYLEEACCRARANGADIRFFQADAEHLPCADRSFDRIWCHAVLHHLDIERAAREWRRVLRPGGRAVCCEPWGENPLLSWARRRVAYPGKERTPDEQPLRPLQVDVLRQHFPRVEIAGFQLIAMAGHRLLGPGRISASLDWCDAQLLRRLPALQRFCRYVVLTLYTDE